MLSNMVANNHMWVPTFKLSYINYKFSLVTLATFQVLNSHTWLVVIRLDNTDRTFPLSQEVLLDTTFKIFLFLIHLKL